MSECRLEVEVEGASAYAHIGSSYRPHTSHMRTVSHRHLNLMTFLRGKPSGALAESALPENSTSVRALCTHELAVTIAPVHDAEELC